MKQLILLVLVLVCLWSCSSGDPVYTNSDGKKYFVVQDNNFDYVLIKQDCSLRDTSDFATSKTIGTISKDTIAQVMDVYGDYVKVEWLKKDGSIGRSGWVWARSVDQKKSITTMDISVKTNCEKGSKVIDTISAGTIIDVVDHQITWVSIKSGNMIGPWIYADYVIRLKK